MKLKKLNDSLFTKYAVINDKGDVVGEVTKYGKGDWSGKHIASSTLAHGPSRFGCVAFIEGREDGTGWR